jgi:hypothetical protein
MIGELRPDLFRKILDKTSEQLPAAETRKAYTSMKLRANKRRNMRNTGTTKWKPQCNDKALVRCQPTSDAAQGLHSRGTAGQQKKKHA